MGRLVVSVPVRIADQQYPHAFQPFTVGSKVHGGMQWIGGGPDFVRTPLPIGFGSGGEHDSNQVGGDRKRIGECGVGGDHQRHAGIGT